MNNHRAVCRPRAEGWQLGPGGALGGTDVEGRPPRPLSQDMETDGTARPWN